jgi:hypothetical protein
VIPPVRGVNDGAVEWKGDIPVWVAVSYPPGSRPEIEAWKASQDGDA